MKQALQAELDEHLDYVKNGYMEKSVIMDDNSTLEPVINNPDAEHSRETAGIKPFARISSKYKKRAPLFNDQIISMYSFGMICRNLKAIYCTVNANSGHQVLKDFGFMAAYLEQTDRALLVPQQHLLRHLYDLYFKLIYFFR